MDSFTWDEYSKKKCLQFEKGGNAEPTMPRLDRSIFTEKPMFSLEAVQQVYKLREHMAEKTGDTKTLRELIHGEHAVPATYRHLNSDTIKHMWGKDLIRNLRRFPTRMEEEDKIALRNIVMKQYGEKDLDTAGITQMEDEDLDEEVIGARAIDADTGTDPVSAKATGGRTIPVVDEDDEEMGKDPEFDKDIHTWVEKRLEALGKRNDERGRDEFVRYENIFKEKHPDEYARWRAGYDAKLKEKADKYRADASADDKIGAGKGIPAEKTSADHPRWIDGKENPEWRKLHDAEKGEIINEEEQSGTHNHHDYQPANDDSDLMEEMGLDNTDDMNDDGDGRDLSDNSEGRRMIQAFQDIIEYDERRKGTHAP